MLDEARTVFRSKRNQPGGFWVAKDDGPAAAAEALTGSRPVTELGGAALLSNGASRVVDRFGLLDWAQVPSQDPASLIRLVREAERAEGWTRTMRPRPAGAGRPPDRLPRVTDLRAAGVAETARLVASGEITARQATDAALERIERLNPGLNAISSSSPTAPAPRRTRATQQGRARPAARRTGRRSRRRSRSRAA